MDLYGSFGRLKRCSPIRAAAKMGPYVHCFFTSEFEVEKVLKGRLPKESGRIILVQFGWKDRKLTEASNWKAGQRLENLSLKSWDAQDKTLKEQAIDDEIMDSNSPWLFVNQTGVSPSGKVAK